MIKNLMKGVFAALLLVSAVASAESQYPAVNFKPEIISQDSEYIAKHGGSSSAGSVSSTSSSSTAVESRSESASSAGVDRPATSGQGNPLEQNGWLILVVVVLGGVMVWSSKNSAKAQSTGSFPQIAAPAGPAGETGVTKYLRSRDGTAAVTGALTGVAKYLANRGG